MLRTETRATILDCLQRIASEVPRYRGDLATFAGSSESLDRMGPESLRADCATIARLVVDEPAEVIAWHHAALAWACQGDTWALAEVAGRFMSAVRRIRLAAKVRAHSGFRYYDLAEAIIRARYTAKQWAFAKKLAAEVDAREEREAAEFLAAHANDYASLCDAE